MDIQALVKVFSVFILVTTCTAQETDKKSWIDFIKPESVKCLNEVRKVQYDCFNTSNLNLTLVDEYLLGRLKHSHLDTEPKDFITNVCTERPTVVECIVHNVLNRRGKGSCVDSEFFNLAVQEMNTRLTLYNNACQAKNIFATSNAQCMQKVAFEMYNCYLEVGLKSHIFSKNTSLEGALIGTDKETAHKYCSKRYDLFKCINSRLNECPGSRDYYLMNGYDYDSMQESIHVLCDEIDLYLKGLECLQQPHQEVIHCVNNYTADVLDLNVRQYLDGATREKFFKEYCKIRVKHIDCDMRAWSTRCQADSIGLKTQHQCTTLPKVCKKDKELKIHETACHDDNYYLKLRNSASRTFSTSYYSLSVFIVLCSGFFHS